MRALPASAKWEFETWHAECSRRRKAAIAELQVLYPPSAQISCLGALATIGECWRLPSGEKSRAVMLEILQRDALLLTCATSQLNAEVKDALRGLSMTHSSLVLDHIRRPP